MKEFKNNVLQKAEALVKPDDVSEKIVVAQGICKIFKKWKKPVQRILEIVHPFRKKYHHPINALNHIHFTIKKGEVLGIIGLNGSGKSTLLKLIKGVSAPTCGVLKNNTNETTLLNLNHTFMPGLNGIENIRFTALAMGFSPVDIKNRISSVIEFSELGEMIEQPLRTYSHGMISRLMFSIGVIFTKRLLLIDEILSVGDFLFQKKCIDKMVELKKEGLTIVFVSHDLLQVKRFCDKVLYLENGNNVFLGSPEEAISTYQHSAGVKVHSNSKKAICCKDLLYSIAKITSITVSNLKLTIHKSFRIKVAYEVIAEDVNDLIIGVGFFNQNRELVFGPNTDLADFSIPTSKGKHVVELNIKSNVFNSGVYEIDVNLLLHHSMVIIDSYPAVFNVPVGKRDSRSEGNVAMHHNWNVLQ